MKFSEKYELLESLTTGAIETFAANDKVRGERVLVHIVDCPPQRSGQSTSEWVLESFRRVAPEPAGPILETGKYGGAQYAYLVTKPADEIAVKNWVRRYELFSQETKETSVHALNPAPALATVTPPAEKPMESPSAPGQMTQLLRDFDSMVKARSSGAPPGNPPVARPVNLAGESGLHAAPRDPANVKPASFKERVPESSSSPVKPVSPEIPAVPSREGPKPGEFTSFFQGPFRGDAPADVPAFSSEPIEPPRKNVGEFTAMFGQAGPATPAHNDSRNKAPATSFTGLFKDMEKPQPSFNSPGSPGGVIPPSTEPRPVPSTAKESSLSPQAPIFVAPQAPVFAEPVITPIPPSPVPPERPLPARPSSHLGDGATGAFRNPSSEPAPAPVAAPSGPSPYTQIISRSKLPESGEAFQNHPSAAPAGGFAAPPMPKIPSAPPPLPSIPPPPPMPKMTAPKAPAAPKMPKLDAAAAAPVSYWPLVITLTVLFFLAALLVLYFVLKH